MSNGAEMCCAVGICCPPASAERVHALAKILADKGSMKAINAHLAAACVLENFDIAPKGTLQPLIDSIATQARAAHT